MAGVSVMTASNVLRGAQRNGRVLFSEGTARKVTRAARKIGYVPNRAARSIRTRSTGVTGFVTSNYSKASGLVEGVPIYPFLVGLSHGLSATGRHVALIELDELDLKKKTTPRVLEENFLDALVIHGVDSQNASRFAPARIPTIYWDSELKKTENCIQRDEFSVGESVTRRLLELGHTRIAFHIGSGANWDAYQKNRPTHFSFPQRYEGYASALRERALPLRRISGYEPERLARQIARHQITAVVASNAFVFASALAVLGKTIPRDFSLLSCDVEAGVFNREGLGGALYNRYEAGRVAAQMIIQRLESQGASVPSKVWPTKISDGSTAAPIRTP